MGGIFHRLFEVAARDENLFDAYCAEQAGLVRLMHALIHLALVVYRGRDSITAR